MTTPNETAGASRNSPRRFWPYGGRAAVKASVLLLPAAVLSLVGLHEADVLESDGVTGWQLLGAVIVGLIPVLLSSLDALAGNAGSVEAPGGVKIAFAAIEGVVEAESTRVALSSVIGGSAAVNVADSGGRAVMEALRPVLGAEIAVVNLGEGKEWWQTRLLLLSSGAVRLGRPRVIVFTATESGRVGQFVGWSYPGELLRVFSSSGDSELIRAHRTGQARANQWALGIPGPGGETVTLPWPASVAGTPQPTLIAPHLSISDMIPEHFLLNELHMLEPPSPQPMPDLALSVALLRGIFATVLRRASIEKSAPDEEWCEAIVRSSEDYFAVTDSGTYVMLFSRQAATNAMLRTITERT